MTTENKKSRPLLLFYILVGYVLLQFAWWSFMMVNLNNEVYHLKSELNLLKASSAVEVSTKGNELEHTLHTKWIMIAGEGSVFLVLLLMGCLQVRTTFKKEKLLALRQKNFLLSITHELKSPLASAQLQLETLQKRKLEEGKQQELISNALLDTRRLNILVENILLAATIDNHTTIIHLENSNVSEFVTSAITQAQQAFSPSQKITLDIEPNVFMDIDKDTFHSILLNLLDNALKYSPENSLVSISLKKKKSSVLLSVSDEGLGIPISERENVFQKFYRIGSEETRRAKGTGIGLYIVQSLTKQHKGSISIKDNIPKGSIFEIIFST